MDMSTWAALPIQTNVAGITRFNELYEMEQDFCELQECIDNTKPKDNVLIVYYCKSLKKTGTPIVISNGKSEIYTDNLILNDVSASMKFRNARGKAKSRRASTCLEIKIKA